MHRPFDVTTQSEHPLLMRRFVFIFILGLVLGLGYLFLEKEEIRCLPVVAVWPGFTPVEPNPDLKFLAEGVGPALENQLASSGDIVVSTMDHWFAINGAYEYATRLGADFLVDGVVHLVDGQIHITVQLFEMQLGEQLWSKSYNIAFAEFREEGVGSAMLQIIEDIHATLPDSVSRSADKWCTAS